MSNLIMAKQTVDPSAPSAGDSVAYPDTDGIWRYRDANGHIGTLSAIKKYNLLRNSGFWFAQRQAPGSATTYSNVGGRATTADGWWVSNANASVTYARVDTSSSPETGLNGRYYGQWLKITSTGKIAIGQAIEANDIQAYRGRNVRLRMRLKATVTAQTYNMALVQLSSTGTVDTIPLTAGNFISAFNGDGVLPTLGSNLAFIAPTASRTGDNCTAGASAYACSVTTSWQRFSGVFTIPSTCKNIIVVVWSENGVVANSGLNIAEPMLCDGEDVQDFMAQSLPEEQYRVQRYYQKSFALETAPATNVGVNTGEARAVAGKAGAVANAGYIPFRFEPKMRASPTVTVYNPAAANALGRDITGTADLGATSIVGTNECGSYTNSTGVAATAVGDLIGIHWSADAEL